MKICHICGSEASDEARFCRSCYAVFTDGDQPALARRQKDSKIMTRIAQAVIVLGLIVGVWFSRVDLALFPDTAQTAGSSKTGSNRGPGKMADVKTDPASNGGTERQWGAPSNSISASSVKRLGPSCAISQAVHNSGERIMFPVTLDFSFKDVFGKRIGDSERVVTDAILPAGERRGFTFQMPCPRTFAHVQIRAVDEHARIGGSGTAEAIAQLLAGKPLIDLNQLHLAIQAPNDLALCPQLKPCQLMLRFNESWISVWFRRDPNDPGTLVASDPQLIGPVQNGWHADVRLPLRHGTENLTVTEEFLREPESTGGWGALKRSIKKMFGISEDSQ